MLSLKKQELKKKKNQSSLSLLEGFQYSCILLQYDLYSLVFHLLSIVCLIQTAFFDDAK